MLLQEVFTEMEEKYGEVEEMNVCDNLGDHLVGNVYVKVRGAAPDRLAVGVRGCGAGGGAPGVRRHPPCRPRPASSWLPGLGGAAVRVRFPLPGF